MNLSLTNNLNSETLSYAVQLFNFVCGHWTPSRDYYLKISEVCLIIAAELLEEGVFIDKSDPDYWSIFQQIERLLHGNFWLSHPYMIAAEYLKQLRVNPNQLDVIMNPILGSSLSIIKTPEEIAQLALELMFTRQPSPEFPESVNQALRSITQ